MKNNRIVFDITELVNWKGNLTGINRVTDEIARRLSKESNSSFIYWENKKKSFKEVDLDYYYYSVHPKNRQFKLDNTIDDQSLESIKEERRGTLFRLARKLAHIVRPILWSIIATRKIIRRLNNIYDSYGFAKSLSNFSFKKGDKFIIPYGSWNNKEYINTVIKFKNEGTGKLIFIAHDIMPITIPHFSGEWTEHLKNFTERITSQADLVLTISNNTKEDLTKYLESNRLKIPKIEIIRLGDTFLSEEATEPTSNKEYLDKVRGNDYILCIGTIEARKNQTLLYYTYKLAESRGLKLPKLVIVGRQGYKSTEIVEFMTKDLQIRPKIAILKDITDSELAWLYSNCRFTIYPSFYEGWGLPIAESLAAGVPCICSNSTSMKEVAPSITPMFNPSSTDECLAQIVSMLDDNTYQKAKKKAGTYKPVSWDTTYANIISLIDKKL